MNKTEVIEIIWNKKKYKESIDNFELSTITPLELKEALNKVSSKFTFWSVKYSEVCKRISDSETKYDMWFAGKYSTVVVNHPKPTETAKKNQIYLDNPDMVKNHFDLMSKLNAIKAKIKAVVNGYEMQSRMLQTIASIMRSELTTLRPGGLGSLED